MNRTLLVMFALAVVAGTEAEQFGVTAPALLIAALLAFSAYQRSDIVRAGMPAALALMALGALNAHLRDRPPDTPGLFHTVRLHGVILEASDSNLLRSVFVLRSDAGIRLEVEARGQAPAIGSRITARGRLEPFDQARNPGETSPRMLAVERGLDARLIHGRILSIDTPDPHDPHIWFPLIRAWAGEQVRERLGEPYASILAGALWGERGALPPDLRAEFQDTGTVHVLVTAGLHLGVVAALCTGLLSGLGLGRIGSSLSAIVVVWLYAGLSGAHLPSLRAAIMVTFALLARAAGRQALTWNALAAAALVIAFLHPHSIASVSFALSFSCVGAILLFASPITAALERFHMPHALNEAIALTLATQIGTWPLTATAFLLFAPYAPLANALVVPIIGAVMLTGIAQLAAAPIGPLAQGLANINASLLMWIVCVVRSISSLPYAHIVITPPAIWKIALYDLLVLGTARLISRGKKRAAALIFICACALIVSPTLPTRPELKITAIDVGQADALLIETPRGHTFLVDAGGRLERGTTFAGASPAEEIGERIVVPFLIRRSIHRLDAILLSHPHGDHAGGVAPVLRTLGANAFADSGQSYPGHAYHEALDLARARRVPMLEPRAGDIWHTDDGVTFRFYGPGLPYLIGTRNDINNNSLVFRVEYKHFSMLFTGDAGAQAEERILARGEDLRADILKVGHHGSAYSSTPAFLHAVRPQIAIISVGRDNLFGHPSERTLSALRAIGAHIYRTDEDGAITIRSSGDKMEITRFLNPEQKSSAFQSESSYISS
jgi:competence protein ComEC